MKEDCERGNFFVTDYEYAEISNGRCYYNKRSKNVYAKEHFILQE